jgi:hypothetical protein
MMRPPEPETIALRTAMSVKPTGPRLGLYNELIHDLKIAGVWAKLDALYLLAAHDAQAARLNIRDPGSFDLTAVSSPTFTTDRGYAGDGSTSYLDPDFVPSVALGQFAQDSCHLGVWSRTDSAANVVDIGGRFDGSTRQSFIQIRTGVDQMAGRLNQNAASLNTAGSISSVGHFLRTRTGAAASDNYKAGVAFGSTANTASTGLTDRKILIGALQNGASVALHSARQYAAAHIGGGLTSQDAAALYAALHAYLAAVGAA